MKMTPEDVERTAQLLQCEPAAIMAVADVESGNRTLTSYLFEPHWFSRLTRGRFDDDHPSVSYRVWDRRKYPKTQVARDDQFAFARSLDRDAAYMATSWGLFQIMGFNHRECGFLSAEVFALDMRASVANNVLAFGMLIVSWEIQHTLQNRDWEAFARRYNGPRFAENDYHVKLAAAYERYSEGG